jgi:hypothetical protein
MITPLVDRLSACDIVRMKGTERIVVWVH